MVMDASEEFSFRVELPAEPPETTRPGGERPRQVYLTGDFNRWSVPGVPMEEEKPGGGRWSVRVRLPRGEHRVGFYAIDWRWKCERLGGGGSRRGYAVSGTRWVGEELTVFVQAGTTRLGGREGVRPAEWESQPRLGR